MAFIPVHGRPDFDDLGALRQPDRPVAGRDETTQYPADFGFVPEFRLAEMNAGGESFILDMDPRYGFQAEVGFLDDLAEKKGRLFGFGMDPVRPADLDFQPMIPGEGDPRKTDERTDVRQGSAGNDGRPMTPCDLRENGSSVGMKPRHARFRLKGNQRAVVIKK